jgi:hypothetical protein
MVGFLFGEGQRERSAAELWQQRQRLEQMASQATAQTPRNVGEGIASIGQALFSRIGGNRLAPFENDERARIAQMLGSMQGGGMPMMPPPMPPQGMPPQGMAAPQMPAQTPQIPQGLPMPPDVQTGVLPPSGGPQVPSFPPVSPDAMLPPQIRQAVDRVDPQPQMGLGAAQPASGPESAIVQGLMERGMPPHIAEGFVMNFRDESGLDPGINEISPLVPGSRGGFGLAQWTGPRRRELEAFAASRGVPVSDKNMQLDFLMQELSGSERRAAERIMQSGSREEAADAILRNFLRPAQEHVNSRSQRYLSGQGPAGGIRPPSQGGGAGGGMMPGGMGGGPDMAIVMQLAEIAGNPYANEGQRMIAQALIGQNMQAGDPMRQLQMQMMQAQLGQMTQPQMPDPTTAMREYELATQQGFQGSFLDYQNAVSEARRPQTNVSVNTGEAPGPRLMGNDGLIAIPDDSVEGGFRFEVAPNSPADLSRQEAERERQFASEVVLTAGQTVFEDTSRALEILDRSGNLAAGPGAFLSRIPATDARTLRGHIESVKGNIGIDQLLKIKASGAGLGAIPQAQLDMLAGLLGNLDQAQGPQDLMYNLRRVQEIYMDIVEAEGGDPLQIYADRLDRFGDTGTQPANQAAAPVSPDQVIPPVSPDQVIPPVSPDQVIPPVSFAANPAIQQFASEIGVPPERLWQLMPEEERALWAN